MFKLLVVGACALRCLNKNTHEMSARYLLGLVPKNVLPLSCYPSFNVLLFLFLMKSPSNLAKQTSLLYV